MVFAMEGLKLVFLKNAAVEVGDFSKQMFYISAPFGFRFREPLKEERAEKFFVVLVGAFRLALCQFGRAGSLDHHSRIPSSE